MMIRRVLPVIWLRIASAEKANPFFFLQRDRHGLRARILDHRLIDGKARIWIHDLNARLAKHHDCKIHRGFPARHDHDIVRIDVGAVAALQVGRNRLAQGGNAIRRRIAMMAVTQRLDARFDNMPRCFEIRLPDAKVDDVAPFAGKLLGPRQNNKRRLRAKS